jgi:hypothetical protein
MKVIFLDFDGVLNNNQNTATNKASPKWSYKHPFIWIEKSMCEQLNSVFDDPDLAAVKIVVSSTWRLSFTVEELREILNEQVPGLGNRVIDVTKDLRMRDSRDRGFEVMDWLARHPEVEKHAIVDDNDWFFPAQHPYFVFTRGFEGITE